MVPHRLSLEGTGTQRRGVRKTASLRIGCLLAFAILWWAAYSVLNDRASRLPYTRSWESPVSSAPWLFQPWTATVYVLGGAALAVAPYVLVWRRFWTVVLVHALGSVVNFAFYLVFPVRMDRPSYGGDSWGERILAWVASVDRPANCFPSSHAFFAVSGAVLLSLAGSRAITLGAWLLALAVLVSTVTVGQHYFVDGLAGAIVAALAWWAALVLLSERPPA